jgi:diguanylate cyclase (GGDEF)-like protein
MSTASASVRSGRKLQGTDENTRSQAIQEQIASLSGRDLQLWSISLLIGLVLSAGFISIIAPNLVWRTQISHIEGRYLPQLLFGLISLVVLFNIYIIAQKRELNSTRAALLQELLHNERIEGFTLVDPLTKLFNRRAVDEILAKEMSRANRMGSELSVLMIEVQSLELIAQNSGNTVADNYLTETARLLRNTLRGSDLVFRYAADQFLVVMPDTGELQAEQALNRLNQALDHWNHENRPDTALALGWGMASRVPGVDAAEMILAASRRMLLRQNKLIPVF